MSATYMHIGIPITNRKPNISRPNSVFVTQSFSMQS